VPETCRVTWQWNKIDCKQLHLVGYLKEYVKISYFPQNAIFFHYLILFGSFNINMFCTPNTKM